MVWLKIYRIERFEWSDRLELTIIHSAIIQFVICNQSLINQTAQSNQSSGDVEFSRYCNYLKPVIESYIIHIISCIKIVRLLPWIKFTGITADALNKTLD